MVIYDDKRLQTFDKITTYLYGTNAFKVCESEMMIVRESILLKTMQIARFMMN